MMSTTRWRLAPLLLCAAIAFAQPARRAVIIDLDGVRRDTFEQVWGQGKLPNLARIFGSAVWFDTGASVFPTVTMAAQASIFTGAPPPRHGIPGNRWFDRASGRVIDYLTVEGIVCVYGFALISGAECAGGWANQHLTVPTLYEAATAAGLTSLVVYSQYSKGATWPVVPTFEEGLTIVKRDAVDYRAFDHRMAERAIAELKSRGLPSILTLYFAGTDEIGHSEGIAGQVPYLAEVVDPLMGRILDTIEALDPAWRDYTLFILTSDHGRTDAVVNPEDRSLLADLKNALVRAGVPAEGTVIADNGGMARVYIRSGTSWNDAPSAGELASVAAALMREPVLAPTVASVLPRGPDDSPRSGDLIVILKRDHYFGNTGKGSHHGNAAETDFSVPLLVAIPGFPGFHSGLPAGITRVAGTIAAWLGFPMESAEPPLQFDLP